MAVRKRGKSSRHKGVSRDRHEHLRRRLHVEMLEQRRVLAGVTGAFGDAADSASEFQHREIQRLSSVAFDGVSADVGLVVNAALPNQQVEVLVGRSRDQLRSVGVVFNIAGADPWAIDIDIRSTEFRWVEFIQVASADSFRLGTPRTHYPSPEQIEGLELATPQQSLTPLIQQPRQRAPGDPLFLVEESTVKEGGWIRAHVQQGKSNTPVKAQVVFGDQVVHSSEEWSTDANGEAQFKIQVPYRLLAEGQEAGDVLIRVEHADHVDWIPVALTQGLRINVLENEIHEEGDFHVQVESAGPHTPLQAKIQHSDGEYDFGSITTDADGNTTVRLTVPPLLTGRDSSEDIEIIISSADRREIFAATLHKKPPAAFVERVNEALREADAPINELTSSYFQVRASNGEFESFQTMVDAVRWNMENHRGPFTLLPRVNEALREAGATVSDDVSHYFQARAANGDFTSFQDMVDVIKWNVENNQGPFPLLPRVNEALRAADAPVNAVTSHYFQVRVASGDFTNFSHLVDAIQWNVENYRGPFTLVPRVNEALREAGATVNSDTSHYFQARAANGDFSSFQNMVEAIKWNMENNRGPFPLLPRVNEALNAADAPVNDITSHYFQVRVANGDFTNFAHLVDAITWNRQNHRGPFTLVPRVNDALRQAGAVVNDVNSHHYQVRAANRDFSSFGQMVDAIKWNLQNRLGPFLTVRVNEALREAGGESLVTSLNSNYYQARVAKGDFSSYQDMLGAISHNLAFHRGPFASPPESPPALPFHPVMLLPRVNEALRQVGGDSLVTHKSSDYYQSSVNNGDFKSYQDMVDAINADNAAKVGPFIPSPPPISAPLVTRVNEALRAAEAEVSDATSHYYQVVAGNGVFHSFDDMVATIASHMEHGGGAFPLSERVNQALREAGARVNDLTSKHFQDRVANGDFTSFRQMVETIQYNLHNLKGPFTLVLWVNEALREAGADVNSLNSQHYQARALTGDFDSFQDMTDAIKHNMAFGIGPFVHGRGPDSTGSAPRTGEDGGVSHPAEPVLKRVDYSGVAKLYRWTEDGWNYMHDSGKLIVDDHFKKRTIMLTHGWKGEFDSSGGFDPDDLNNSRWIRDFARNLARCDSARLNNDFTVIAVDWHAGGSDKGSLDSWYSIPTKSARNGREAGRHLGQVLKDAGVDPSLLYLIGHSNGAGLMGSLATAIATSSKRVATLVALDASHRTVADDEVRRAAGRVEQVLNYYVLENAVVNSGPMFDAGNIVNFRLGQDISQALFPEIKGWMQSHSRVPLRYAQTACYGSQLPGDADWGFQSSVWGQAPFSRPLLQDKSYWHEITTGDFEARASERDSRAQAWEEATITAVPLWNSELSNGRSVVDIATDRFRAYNANIGSALSTESGGSGPIMHGLGNSPIYAALDMRIPDDANLLVFDLTVLNSGNKGYDLLIGVNSDVIAEVDLDLQRQMGSERVDFDVAKYAGEDVTISFYMPAEEANDAEFLISGMEFVSLNSPPLLAPIGDVEVTVGKQLNIQATASDPESDNLTFSLGGRAPVGSSIDPVTGVFTWAVPEDLELGNYLISVTASDDGPGSLVGWTEFEVSVTGGSLDRQPPQVLAVKAASSTWDDDFVRLLDPISEQPLENLTWPSLDRIFIEFSEDVSTSLDLSKIAITGANVADYRSLMTDLVFDPATNLAMVQLSAPIGVDKLRLSLASTITDGAGNALDGGATDGAFSIRFNVLPGDVNSDGLVTGGDMQPFATAFFAKPGDANYNVRLDMNGDGLITGGDLQTIGKYFFQQLPSTEPQFADFFIATSGNSDGDDTRKFTEAADHLFTTLFDEEEEEDEEKMLFDAVAPTG